MKIVNIIEVNNLSKSYGDIKAVNDISFSVKKGSLFAFLGPNGAGKSTTINVLITLLKKDTGNIMVCGSDNENTIRKKIGVVFQNNVLDDLLTVKENLLYRGALFVKNKKDLLKRYEELKELLDFKNFEKQKFRTLSGGQKRKVEIARALFSNPEVLLLDEPTTGLDPETRKIVWEVINGLRKKEGITIFLTTHYMEEAANADYVVIIDNGVIVTEGSPAELKEKYSFDSLIIHPKRKDELIEYLKKENKEYQKVADQFIIRLNDTEEAIKCIIDLKGNIKLFEVKRGNMDDVFINAIGGNGDV